MKGLDERYAQMMIELSREGRCAECATPLGDAGIGASVPGYPPNLDYCSACLKEIGEALFAVSPR